MVSKGCAGWIVAGSRRARRWLRRHPEAVEYYERAREIISGDPYAGEPLRGRCHGIWGCVWEGLRLSIRAFPKKCMVSVEAVGYRENIYEGMDVSRAAPQPPC